MENLEQWNEELEQLKLEQSTIKKHLIELLTDDELHLISFERKSRKLTKIENEIIRLTHIIDKGGIGYKK